MVRPRGLTGLPFELAYLARLTQSGLKPLSRWETALAPGEIDLLANLGLHVENVTRRTLIGRRVPEVVFSASARYADAYKGRFDARRLRSSAKITRLEGQLFGYPSCCVEQFVRRPYVPNDLSREDQAILFHWACPGCRATPVLLREYRRVYRDCARLFAQERPRWSPAASDSYRSTKRSGQRMSHTLPWAAGLTALALLPGLCSGDGTDRHWLPAADDEDGDFLTHTEEILLGRNPWLPDGDGSLLPDGVDEALRLSERIAALPSEPIPDGPYLTHHSGRGFESCLVCGQLINMGGVSITHPLRDLEIFLPYMSLHYLEHGSLAYDGSEHGGRVDLDMLIRIVSPHDPPHFPERWGWWGDRDQDGLSDDCETVFLTDPGDPDTDGDSVLDGPQVAEDLLPEVSALPREAREDGPYLLEHPSTTSGPCEICGEQITQGKVEIVNPAEGLALELPSAALHYLAHGSFVSQDSHGTRVLIASVLRTVLRSEGHAHWIPIEGDRDSDGLRDGEEVALDLDPDSPDTDGDGTLDGPSLAKFLYDAVRALPYRDHHEPPPDHIYIDGWPAAGTYPCLVCGEPINMGNMIIVDPTKGKSVQLTFYNLHFMSHGSFSTDRPDFYPRAWVEGLADLLGIPPPAQPLSRILVNSPNPFTSMTEIDLSLPAEERVTLSVFDASGRRVVDLYTGRVGPEPRRFVWDGRDGGGRTVAPGVYFARLEASSFTLKRKMLLVE